MPLNPLRIASLVRRSAFIAGLWACCLGTGCGSGGGQTGGEFPAPGLGCNHEYEALTLDAPTPLGATAATVLAPVLGTHTAPLLWRADTGSVTVGPEQGLSQVELIVSYEGGRVAWAFVPPGDAGAATGVAGGAPATAFGCPLDRLEVEVTVQLRTGQGALDERFVATLGAIAADNAQLFTRLPLDALQGSLFVTGPAGATALALQVSVAWDVVGFHGTLLGEVEYREPNSGNADSTVGFGFVPYADWPPPTGAGRP
jgi:hypothetical protein